MKGNWHRKIIAIILLLGAITCSTFFSPIYAAEGSLGENGESNLSVTFFNVGTGDCTFIQYENCEMLIDAGEKQGGDFDTLDTIYQYILDHCQDKVLEYVIVTHGDSDHLGCMGAILNKLIALSGKFQIGTLIDFDSDDKSNLYSTNAYAQYVAARKKLVKKGVTYKTSQSFWPEHAEQNTAVELPFSKLTDGPRLYLLYNPYYFYKTTGTTADEKYKNVVSVCLLVKYGESSILLTGDLEEQDTGANGIVFGGESKLLQYNKNLLQKGVTIFKAGHHGSTTANSEALVKAIRPRYVVISAIATSREASGYWGFPKQAVINRFLQCTDQIFVTSMDAYPAAPQPYYGRITFLVGPNEDVTVTCSNESMSRSGVIIPFVQTEWFLNNRMDLRDNTLSVTFLTLDECDNARGNCTLIQYKDVDILIDCGIDSSAISEINTMYFVDKLKSYCTDGVLEYVIVTHSQTESISNLIGTYSSNGAANDGVFGTFKINNLIDFGQATSVGKLSEKSWLRRYYEQRNVLIAGGTKHYAGGSQATFKIAPSFTMTTFNQNNVAEKYKDENDYSVCVLLNFWGEYLVFSGDLTDGEGAESLLAEQLKSVMKTSKAALYVAGNGGHAHSSSGVLLDAINPQHVVVTGTAGMWLHMTSVVDFSTCQRLINKVGVECVYLLDELEGNDKKDAAGTLTFEMVAGAKNTETAYNIICENANKKDALLYNSNWFQNCKNGEKKVA